MTMTNGDVEEQRQKKKFFVCGGPARRICWHILEKQFSKMLTHIERERERETVTTKTHIRLYMQKFRVQRMIVKMELPKLPTTRAS